MVSRDLIVIDSLNRNSGSAQSLSYSLDENLHGIYELASFEMVNNIYNVIAGYNDKLYVNTTADGSVTVTLTPGNYTSSTLVAMLKVVMDAALTPTHTVAYNADTGKILFTPSAGNVGFEFSSNTLASCRALIGKNAVDDVLGATQLSDNPIDLNPIKMLSLKISQDGHQHVTLSGGTESSFVLSLENTGFGQVYHYKRNNTFGQFCRFQNSVGSIDVVLYDHLGNAAPINGSEWQLSVKKISDIDL